MSELRKLGMLSFLLSYWCRLIIAVVKRLVRRGKVGASVLIVLTTRLIVIEVVVILLLVIELLPVRSGCSVLMVLVKPRYVVLSITVSAVVVRLFVCGRVVVV